MNARQVSRAPGEPSPHQQPTELRRTFARNLRQARKAAGLTQHALAKVASCSRAQIAAIETDAANVKLDTITRLAKALGLTEGDLLRPDMNNAMKRASRVPAEPLSKTEPTEFRRRFARNLRAIRLAAGLSQDVIAKAAAMNLSVISDIEVNAKNVTLDTVTRLAQQIGCSEIDLLGPGHR
ncbi:MAG: helix-turn-helix transcriptional regulator [Mycobacterium sp.]